jgi:hypothetical protein
MRDFVVRDHASESEEEEEEESEEEPTVPGRVRSLGSARVGSASSIFGSPISGLAVHAGQRRARLVFSPPSVPSRGSAPDRRALPNSAYGRSPRRSRRRVEAEEEEEVEEGGAEAEAEGDDEPAAGEEEEEAAGEGADAADEEVPLPIEP